jgi:hypothetical protein
LVALTLGSLFGNRLDRAMEARTAMGRLGYWAGMRVGPRAVDLAHAALQIQRLTAPTDTVLVLPEDVQLAALISRPRPRLRGAIVFVDQYPRRLAPDDIQELRRHPPKVIVRHPAEAHLWTQLFRVWSGDSGAQQVLDFVNSELLPNRFERLSVTRTSWLWRDATLEIWVRREPAPGEGRLAPAGAAE